MFLLLRHLPESGDNFVFLRLRAEPKTPDMKKILYLLLLCAALSSCSKSGNDGPDERTVLVYIAGANDLSPYAASNVSAMVDGYRRAEKGRRNLLVYYDVGDGRPRLLWMNERGAPTLKEYPGANSTSAANLKAVISDVLRTFPAKGYGLVLWSHANGWIPKDFPLAVKNRAFMAAFPNTRTFGYQYFQGENYQIELPDLADAIPSGVFGYLITDACLLGGVETMYALRDKADYIITYPTEVIADGMPYRDITPDLVSSKPLETVCRNISAKFFDYYNVQNGLYRSASVALVKTAGLKDLASAVRDAVKDNPAVAALPLSAVQHYDLYTRPFMYDLDDFVKQVASEAQYETFRAALDKTVLYQAHTPYFFSLKLERCCGLSSYIPSDVYAAYNPHYYDTEWYKACYL